MKLVHYFPTTLLTEGGTVRAAIDFCSVLAQRGHDVTWMTCDDTDVPASWKNKEAGTPTVVFLGNFEKSGRRLTIDQRKVATNTIQHADVVHIHAMWDLSNPQIAKVCVSLDVPWVLSIHGMLDDWSMAQRTLKKKLYLATAGKILATKTTTFCTTAVEERNQASRWLKHDNIAIIPYIVDLTPYGEVPTPNLAIDAFGTSDKPTILFLSRVHEKKSIETLIDATAILKQRGKPIRLLIAGTGEQSYINTLTSRAKDAFVEDDVIFLGMVVGDLKLSLYAMADIFALPTQQENFGLVYPEALLCETPIIGTKGTDIWRELEEGGAVIADRTPEAFADAIESLSIDKERLQELGEIGREHMLRWLDTNTVAEQYEQLYLEASSAH